MVLTVHSSSAGGDIVVVSFFLFFKSNWLLKCFLWLFGRPSYMTLRFAHNDSEGIIYKSHLKWGKKRVPICSQLFGLLFILVLAFDKCPSVLCLTKVPTFAWQVQRCDPPPGWLQAIQCTGTVSGINWEQGRKTTQLQVFALLKRQPQNRIVLVFELITGDFKNSHLNQLVTFAIVT